MSAHSSQPGANSPRPRVKPIADEIGINADEIGINWQTVTRRLEAGRYLHRRLGVKVTPSRGGQKPDICIRIDRVTALGVPADTFENPQQSLPLTGGAA